MTKQAFSGQALSQHTERLGETVAPFIDNYLARWRSYKPGWVYEDGVIFKGALDLWRATGAPEFLQFVERNVAPRVAEDGEIEGYDAPEFNIDHICAGKVFFPLLEHSGDPRFQRAIERQAVQLAAHPRTKSGNYWHKQIYPSQVWLDGLYMGQPFQLALAQLEQRPELAADTVRQFVHVQRVLRDTQTGLYFHGWDESRSERWADRETGCSSCFWGRAMGWYMMALVDCLDFAEILGSDGSTKLGDLLRGAADALLRVRSESGLWYQVLDRGAQSGNYEEASASLMIAYALMKGQRQGFLSPAAGEQGREALVAVVRKFLSPQHLDGICGVAGLGGTPYRDGSFAYYLSEPIVPDDPKGVGALLMAVAEAVRRPEAAAHLGPVDGAQRGASSR
jgi:unsaturated rhamnogalacturonyl hydrolase